jgi:hypothetical protein
VRVYHELLVDGGGFARCSQRVLRFFEIYDLIAPQNIDVLRQRSIPATDPLFWPRIDEGEKENHAVLGEFIEELKQAGAATVDDLGLLPQGYKSKILHTVTHLLDGFFGVDSYLYNLVEDSHWISPELRQRIDDDPPWYWLITVEAVYAQEGRGFEKKILFDKGAV